MIGMEFGLARGEVWKNFAARIRALDLANVKVGGHLVENFPIHNSFWIFSLNQDFRVDGQLVHTREPMRNIDANPTKLNLYGFVAH